MTVDDTLPRRNLPTEAEQWGRALEGEVKGAQTAITGLDQDLRGLNRYTAASLKGIANQLQKISETIEALPVTTADSEVVTAISSSTLGFVTMATGTLTVPENKTQAVLFMSGTIALLDTVTGGIAAPPYARFLVQSSETLPTASGVPATKDAGASSVNNVVSLSATSTLTGLTPGASVTVELQVEVFHASAYATGSPSNFASLAVQGTFTP